MSDGCQSPGVISSPLIPDESFGSSVSTSMQEEYEELLKYSVVVPKYDPKIGPQILENFKGLFMTTEQQIKFRDHLEQQKLVNSKFESKKIEENVAKTVNEMEEMVNKTIDDTLEGIMSTSINTTNSFSPKHIGLLRPVNNSIYFNIDENFTSITHEEESTDMFNNVNDTTYINRNNNYNNNNNCNDENNDINLNLNVNNNNNTNNNDINPRKHSPVPISPPTNIEYTADNSIDIIQNHLKQKTLKHQHNHTTEDKLKHDLKMTSSLDKWFKEFKTHVISELEKSRLQIMEQQQKRLIEEKEKQAAEILKLQKEVEMMRQNLNDHEKNTERKDTVISNLSKALEKQREKNEAQRTALELKIKRLENSREAFTAKIAEKFYDYRIKSKVFLNWHSIFINRHKTKVEKACKKKAEEVCLDLANQYQEKIKKLEDELKISKETIDTYRFEMGRCEENMKRALMRGVCALNLEAMSIFNDDLSNSNSGNSTARKTVNTNNVISNDNINNAKVVETYFSNENIINHIKDNNNVINNDNSHNNEQLFRSSQNNIGINYGRKINDENSLKTLTINCDTTKQTLINSKIPTIIVENNKLNELNNDNIQKINTNTQLKTSVNSKPNVKAKVNSNANATYPYRSIIIEKHTKTLDDINKVYQYLPTTTTKTTGLTSQAANSKVLSNAKKNLLIKCSN